MKTNLHWMLDVGCWMLDVETIDVHFPLHLHWPIVWAG
jgi:hypothetical protein